MVPAVASWLYNCALLMFGSKFVLIIASDIDLMKLGNLTVVLYTTTIYMLVFGLHLG